MSIVDLGVGNKDKKVGQSKSIQGSTSSTIIGSFSLLITKGAIIRLE